MTQLALELNQVVPTHVMDAIAWAHNRNGELVVVVNGNTAGAGAWLRENLDVKAVAWLAETNQTAVKAIAPAWVSELMTKKWCGGSGSSHPVNYIEW